MDLLQEIVRAEARIRDQGGRVLVEETVQRMNAMWEQDR